MTTLKSLVAGLLLAALAPAAAHSAQLLWTFDNEYYSTISLEFYSEDRSHVWPGNGEVYVIDPHEGRVEFLLECGWNEKICYGAWVRGDSRTFWGVGLDAQNYCSDCCYHCTNNRAEPVNLLP